MKGLALRGAVAVALVLTVAGVDDSPHNLCTKPVEFYTDCKFQLKLDSVRIGTGSSLQHVNGEPEALVVPAGCRTTLYSKTFASYSSSASSHALFVNNTLKKTI